MAVDIKVTVNGTPKSKYHKHLMGFWCWMVLFAAKRFNKHVNDFTASLEVK